MGHQYFNEWKFYLDVETGYWISTTCPHKRMHVVVWEFNNCKVPKGYHVHHLNGNKSDNSITNLRLLPKKQHLSLHMTEEKRSRAKEMADKYRPLTKEWHSSLEGLEWHKKHGILGWKNREPFERFCSHCNCKFLTKVYHNRFCSNNCRSAWRRKNGIDDIEIECEICNKKFRKNKYDKVICCSMSCAAKLRWRKRNQTKAE